MRQRTIRKSSFNWVVVCSLVVIWLFPQIASGQSLTGIRIEGPNEVVEESSDYYRAIAQFDNGLEFDVTLSTYLWVEPGTYADIGLFGDLDTYQVPGDLIETIHAYYTFGAQEASAAFDVTILDVPLAGHALDFDGNNDYVSINESPSLQELGAGEFTVSAWVYLTSIHPKMSIVRNDHDYNLFIINGKLKAEAFKSNTMYAATGSDTLTMDNWYHLAAVWDGSVFELYINAVLTSSTTSSQSFGMGPHPLWIGRSSPFYEPLSGLIDEVRIWNVARTACEIWGNMHRQLHGNEPGLVGYWRFDEGAGQIVKDSSQYSNDGRRGDNDDPHGDQTDPTWVISQAQVTEQPFAPAFWNTPVLVPEISSGADWEVCISSDSLSVYLCSERDGFAASDIYWASRNSIDEPFSTPVVIPELSIPGYENHDISPFISANGLRIYFGRKQADNPANQYVAQRDNLTSPWGTPEPIDSINTTEDQHHTSLTSDELAIVYTGHLEPGQAWCASRQSITDPWDNISTIDTLGGFKTRSCSLSADGLTLYVTAQGSIGLGGLDVWKLTRASRSDSFGEPVHIPELSSPTEDFDVSLSADGGTMYLVRKRSNGGDVYMSQLIYEGPGPIGDLNDDCTVDWSDFGVFAAHWLEGGCEEPDWCGGADLDHSGQVDWGDFAIFAAHWLEGI